MKITNCFILFFLALLFSCSQGTEKTSVKVSIAAITGSEKFPGGLFLYGKNHETNLKMSKRVPAGDTLELELENGNWGFVLIGWDGSQYYEGNNYCDFTTAPVELEGDDKELEFEVSRAKCAFKWINGTNENNVDFYGLDIHTCAGIQGYLSSGENIPAGFKCDGSFEIFDGGAKYFSVSLIEYSPETGPIFSSKSRCLSVTNAKAASNLKLPFSSDALNAAMVVTSYKDAGCRDISDIYTFKDGLWKLADGARAIGILDSTGDKVNLYTHSELCNDEQRANFPFAATIPGSPNTNLICSPTQFQNIGSSGGSFLDEKFILGSDINMSGLSTIVSGSFTGSIKGEYKRLYNGNQPIFQAIAGSSGKDVEIKNIIIDNFNIIEAGAPTNNALGILARTITATTDNIEITDITISPTSKVELSAVDGATISGSTDLGALAGDVTSGGSEITIRNVFSFAEVIGHDQDIRVGGLVGSSDGSSGEIKLELNKVGDQIHRPFISGNRNVGGLVGQLKNTEVSEGNNLVVEISGVTNIGGVVGDAQTGSEIRNTSVDAIFKNHASLDATNVGGVIGAVAGDFEVHISGVLSKFKVLEPAGSEEVDKLGGLVGGFNIGGGQTNSFRISDSKANVDFKIDGSYHGGFIGNFDIAGAVNNAEVINSISMGIMDQKTASSNNKYKGGFAGKTVKLSIERSVTDMNLISAYSYTGGGTGEGHMDVVEESHIQGNIECFAGANTRCGGIVGYSGAAVGLKYQKIKTNVDVKTVNDGSGTPVKTGLMVGEITTDNVLILGDILAMGSVENSGGSLSYPDCGGFCIANEEYAASSLLTSDGGGCGSLSGEFDNNSGFCQLRFHRRWEEYGRKNIGTPGYALEFLAGNIHEPFEINSAAHWNEVQDDIFLMDKTFKLQSDLNFQDIGSTDNILPFGTNSNPFKGRIIANGNSLLNVDYTVSGNYSGVFQAIEGATIGWYGDPLKIDGIDLDCGSFTECGTIGKSEDSNLFLVVRDAIISGSGVNLGGFVGYGIDRLTIKESSFQGKVLGTNNYVGGLVGTFDGDLHIEETAIYLDKITGFDQLGAVLGHFNSGGNADKFSIENSYIVFDEKGAYPGDNFNGSSGTQMGALFGYAVSADVVLNNLYMDTRNLVIGNGALRTTYNKSGGTNDLTEFYKIGNGVIAGLSLNGITEISKPSSALNDFENNDGEGKWNKVGDDLYLSWEQAVTGLAN